MILDDLTLVQDLADSLHWIDLRNQNLTNQELRALLVRQLERVRTTSHPCYIQRSSSRIRAVVSDLDGTLIAGELLPLLADELGLAEPMVRLTEQAMRGETDFETSFRQRTQMLAGLPLERLHRLAHKLSFASGVEAGVAILSRHNLPMGIASGAYSALVAPLAKRLGITSFVASEPEVEEGVLTGGFSGRIICPEDKAEYIRSRSIELGVSTSHFLTIGDGANDLEMFLSSGHILLYSAMDEAIAPPLDQLLQLLL